MLGSHFDLYIDFFHGSEGTCDRLLGNACLLWGISVDHRLIKDSATQDTWREWIADNVVGAGQVKLKL